MIRRSSKTRSSTASRLGSSLGIFPLLFMAKVPPLPSRTIPAETRVGASPSDGQFVSSRKLKESPKAAESQVALLTGGSDRPYAIGLATALIARDLYLDFIGSDELDSPELRVSPKLTFLNLRGNQAEDASLLRKISRVLTYYVRLIRYVSGANPKILHILWNNKFEFFDRTLLMLYYKLQGKRIAFTAHNVNAGRRDSKDSLLNRLSLKVQYRLADHIFVHTETMKKELLADFGVRAEAITVIPLGINNSVPDTDLTPRRAKKRLRIGNGERVILFFGRIAPYKGVEVLVDAFQRLVAQNPDYRLVIAGRPSRGCESYFHEIQREMERIGIRNQVIQRIEHIPDEETELYFKAADVLALPYTDSSQSGVLILGYGFGIPVIATDVGSFRQDIIEGRTGLLCRPRDPVDLAQALEAYFQSGLFKDLDRHRSEIRAYALQRYSWDAVSQTTHSVYEQLLAD
jgi:D-inositol-3-phosphate glycosyltransferase